MSTANEPSAAHLARLRALTARGDGDAAERLRAEAVRRELDDERRLATRVLVETGRWQLECGGHTLAFGAERRRPGLASFDAPYQAPELEVYVGPRCVAMVAGRTSWCSGSVPARVVVETLRACFESNHRFEADRVFRDASVSSRSMIALLAHTITACQPAPVGDDDVHGLGQALELANARLRACNAALGFPAMFGACVDALVLSPPRIEIAHVGLGTVLHAREAGLCALTTRQDEATRQATAGTPPFNPLAPGQAWSQVPGAQAGQFGPDDAGWLQRIDLELDLDEELLVVTDAVARRLHHGGVWPRLRTQPAQRACERLVALAAHEGNRWDGGAGAALVRLVPRTEPSGQPGEQDR